MGWLSRLATLAGLVLAVVATSEAQSWRDLSPNERYEAMRNYEQHKQLPGRRREDVESQYDRWRSMSPDEKDRVRRNYDKLQKMPPQERQQFDRKADKWRRERE